MVSPIKQCNLSSQIDGLSYTAPPSWLFDSFTSHYITKDLQHLSIKGEDNEYFYHHIIMIATATIWAWHSTLQNINHFHV